MKKINPYKSFPCALVPNWLMTRPEVSTGAKLLYGRLMQYSGKNGRAFPTQETMSKELGVSQRSIRAYLAELRCQKLIEVRHRGLMKSNVYFFLEHIWMPDRKVSSWLDRQDTAGLDRKEPAYKEEPTVIAFNKAITSEEESPSPKGAPPPSQGDDDFSLSFSPNKTLSQDDDAYEYYHEKYTIEEREKAREWLRKQGAFKTIEILDRCNKISSSLPGDMTSYSRNKAVKVMKSMLERVDPSLAHISAKGLLRSLIKDFQKQSICITEYSGIEA